MTTYLATLQMMPVLLAYGVVLGLTVLCRHDYRPRRKLNADWDAK
jgi:hypothetical protein